MKTDLLPDGKQLKQLVGAIRAKCLDCSDNSPTEVDLCPVHSCPLYPYRLGKPPEMQQSRLPEKQANASREPSQMTLPLK